MFKYASSTPWFSSPSKSGSMLLKAFSQSTKVKQSGMLYSYIILAVGSLPIGSLWWNNLP